jgi:hypothetical protein
MDDEDREEGGPCPECGPEGRMGFKEVEGCSCHINPPCNQCVTNPLVCLSCGWQEDNS